MSAELSPNDAAWEDFQESDRYADAVEAVRGHTVDEVELGEFLSQPVSLKDALGEDVATDIAQEGIIHGFEAGFEYATQGALGAFANWLEATQRESYGVVLPDVLEVLEQLRTRAGSTDTADPELVRAALDAVLEQRFPPVEPYEKRSPPVRGDDHHVDARDDERSAVGEFIDELLDAEIIRITLRATP